MKANFDVVDEVFIDAVVDNAEIKDVSPLDISLILFPQKQKNGKFKLRVAITSPKKAFKDEIKKLRSLTMYDMMGHISKAIMKIFEHEIKEHNRAVEQGAIIDSTKNFNHPISMDSMECYVEVIKNDKDKWSLNMNLIWDYNFLRKYSLREEFGEIEYDQQIMAGL